MKVQEALRKEGAFRFRNSEDEVELIRGIPERFKIQLHEEMYATTLMKCHFWPDRQLQEEDWMGIFHFFCLKTPTPTWGNHIFKWVGSTTNQRSSFSFDFFVTRACEKLRRLQDRTFSCLEMIAPMPMSYRVESWPTMARMAVKCMLLMIRIPLGVFQPFGPSGTIMAVFRQTMVFATMSLSMRRTFVLLRWTTEDRSTHTCRFLGFCWWATLKAWRMTIWKRQIWWMSWSCQSYEFAPSSTALMQVTSRRNATRHLSSKASSWTIRPRWPDFLEADKGVNLEPKLAKKTWNELIFWINTRIPAKKKPFRAWLLTECMFAIISTNWCTTRTGKDSPCQHESKSFSQASAGVSCIVVVLLVSPKIKKAMETTQIEPQRLINPYKIQKAQRVLKQFQSPSIAGGAKNKFRPFVSPMLFILISSRLQGGMMGNWAICINRLADEVTWLWEQGSTQRRPQNDVKARCQREGIDRWITDLCPYMPPNIWRCTSSTARVTRRWRKFQE